MLIKHFLKCNRENTSLGQIAVVENAFGELEAVVVTGLEAPTYQGSYPVCVAFNRSSMIGLTDFDWFGWDELLWTRFRISGSIIESRTEDGLQSIHKIAGKNLLEFVKNDANMKDAMNRAPDQVIFMPKAGEKIPSEARIVEEVFPAVVEAEPEFAELFDPNDVAMFVEGLQAVGYGLEVVNRKWNTDLVTGKPIQRDPLHMQMLIVSEIAEATEGCRKGLMDDHLPHRKMEEVEMADAIIRILDYANVRGLDLAGAIMEKIEYNMTRKDHKREARLAEGGKKV
ncbi:nucleoside triphosphate pyrophosphohydrolase domain-containing protein [Pseudomonas phage EM]|uniref:Nucleoside triphosphate pyrophosphohydrolase domain-containing protein n=1 Tax=Pseudomonas phage EM TaxID=2936914 RepID=A0AAE9KU76_9CAUD|nr:nucleoside triphosphate pyrophosphohydrolase domain-containing protein [Pseudomonas phage EM]UPW35901.1 nucleoside triphosphate pyrophosphohydrolase domain-containing protein [Pseudomonas phage EM]